MDTLIYLLAIIGGLCLIFTALTAIAGWIDQSVPSHKIVRKAPMMREEYK